MGKEVDLYWFKIFYYNIYVFWYEFVSNYEKVIIVCKEVFYFFDKKKYIVINNVKFLFLFKIIGVKIYLK